MVVKGYTQIPGSDYYEAFSLTPQATYTGITRQHERYLYNKWKKYLARARYIPPLMNVGHRAHSFFEKQNRKEYRKLEYLGLGA